MTDFSMYKKVEWHWFNTEIPQGFLFLFGDLAEKEFEDTMEALANVES